MTVESLRPPIGRSEKDRKKQAVTAKGKPAVTRFQVLERFGDYSLLELQLETGRTHQIRVHMAYIGHPVAGDEVYGPRKTLKGHGQFLHAKTLGFTHQELVKRWNLLLIFQKYSSKPWRNLEKNNKKTQ